MRIFYASTYTTNNYMPASRLWYINLYLPLLDLGHEVVPFEYDLLPHYQHADPRRPGHQEFIQTNRDKLEAALLQQVESAHRQKPIDVFFSYFYSAFCRPEVILDIRRMGITTMNWYCNGSYQFDLVSEIAPAYDYCLVPERFRLADYRRIGANPIYFQEAANPDFYKPYPLVREFDVTFVGQRYGERPEHIRFLLDHGIDIHVWGQGWLPETTHPFERYAFRGQFLKIANRLMTANWRNAAARKSDDGFRPTLPPESPLQAATDLPLSVLGPPLSDEELVKMYSRSKISLGFSTCGDTHTSEQRIVQVRLRDFEAPMSGAFYMVEYMEELEEFFDIGKEIVCYRDRNDLADKIKYYLKHEGEREQIRQAGHRRALRDHTWQKRFQALFNGLQLA
jgi:spore maturation protein CgeB